MTLTGKFATAREVQVRDLAEALAVVERYAADGGYTHVRALHEDEYSLRYTARTPGGRGGRNVAYLDLSAY